MILDKNELVDLITNFVDEGIRKSKYETYDEWQKAISELIEDKSKAAELYVPTAEKFQSITPNTAFCGYEVMTTVAAIALTSGDNEAAFNLGDINRILAGEFLVESVRLKLSGDVEKIVVRIHPNEEFKRDSGS